MDLSVARINEYDPLFQCFRRHGGMRAGAPHLTCAHPRSLCSKRSAAVGLCTFTISCSHVAIPLNSLDFLAGRIMWSIHRVTDGYL
jgi:hypothetical protein